MYPYDNSYTLVRDTKKAILGWTDQTQSEEYSKYNSWARLKTHLQKNYTEPFSQST